MSPSEERLLEHYEQLGFGVEYELAHGSKSPDFTLSKNGAVIAVAEAKEESHSKAELSRLRQGETIVMSGDPYRFIRKSIDKSSRQFQKAKEHPCILLLNTLSHPLPVIVLAAMLGDLAVTFNVSTDGGPVDSKSAYVLGDHGRMLHSKITEPYNRTISAIGIVGTVRPGEIESDFLTALGALKIKDAADYFASAQSLRKRFEKAGHDLTREACSISYVENPFARLRFPEHLAGPYDLLFKYDLDSGQFHKTYDGLEMLHRLRLGE